MPYVTQTEIQNARIPAELLTEALDDDRDGMSDAGVLEGIISAASTEIDGLLSARYTVPFTDPAPPVVKSAALAFVCAAIYRKRGYDDEKNPHAKQEEFWRKHLQKIGQGESTLDASQSTSTGGAWGGPARVPGRTSLKTP